MSRYDKTAQQIQAIREREANRLKIERAVDRRGPAYGVKSMDAKTRSEFPFPGGIFEEGCERNDRTDLYLVPNGPAGYIGAPVTLDLEILTGAAVVTIGECLPADLVRLGQWLIETAAQMVEPYVPQPVPCPVFPSGR